MRRISSTSALAAAALLLIALAALPSAAGAVMPRSRPRTLQQTTSATATSVSTGTPSVTNAVATNGQQVVSNVVNGVPVASFSSSASGSSPAGAAGAEQASPPNCAPSTSVWETAVFCNANQNVSNTVLDLNGRPWGFENGCSCKYPPACTGTKVGAVTDASGNLWSFENGQSCRFP